MTDKTQADTPAEFGEDPKAVARYWRAEIAAADAREKDWRKRGGEIVDMYRAEKDGKASTSRGNKAAFNILFSNVETERPALYSTQPRPDVRRRYRDDDKVGKAVAEVIERALSFTMDQVDFDRVMESAIDDMLLPGRGAVWLSYRPEMGQVPGPDGQLTERVLWQSVVPEHVAWDDLRFGPCKDIGLTPWVGRRLTPDKIELLKMFDPEAVEKIPLNYTEAEGDKARLSKDDQQVLSRAQLWQIWDIRARKVVTIADGLDEPVEIAEDALKLKGFVPMPRPLEAVRTTNSTVPVPPYDTYKEQAEELDAVSKRIIRLVRQIKITGGYDKQLGDDVSRILKADDGTLIGFDNWVKFAEGGGFKGSLQFLPIDQVIAAVAQLYQNRDQIKQVIFEMVGLADIMRGASKSDETLGAQKLKTAWGGLRINRRQKQVQRFARDILRLMAEIIAEHYTPEVLAEMTGLKFPQTAAEAEARRDQLAQAQATGSQVPASAMEDANKPSWDEIMAVLRSDEMRNFRIDVETDSTVADQDAQDIGALRDLLTGIVQFINGIAPAVQAGAIPMEAAKAMLLAVVRRAKMGREVEDAVNQIGQPSQANAPQPIPGIGHNGGPPMMDQTGAAMSQPGIVALPTVASNAMPAGAMPGQAGMPM